MLYRSLLAGLALTTCGTGSDAGPFRRHAQPAYQPSYQPYSQPVYPSSGFAPAVGYATGPAATVTPAEYTSNYTPAVATGSAGVVQTSADGFAGDGLDEVNTKRMARGLRPFVRDEGLAQAA